MLRTIGLNCIPMPWDNPDVENFLCEKENFKIVYVAPMKALAAEIVEKMGKRLAWLGIQVRELTGSSHAQCLRTTVLTYSKVICT